MDGLFFAGLLVMIGDNVEKFSENAFLQTADICVFFLFCNKSYQILFSQYLVIKIKFLNNL